jgi:hypothetical protein
MSATSFAAAIADEREQANVLRLKGHPHDAELVEQVVDRLARAAEEYLTWLSEDEARLRSGKSAAWLRARFTAWEAEGHARYHGRRREYLMLVVPQRVHPSAARVQGREAGAA